MFYLISFLCFLIGLIAGIVAVIIIQEQELEDEEPKTVREKKTKGMK
jgi:hypothetical protein